MSNEVSSTSSGIGFFGLLTIVFIVLKLCHVISWSWLLVLSPSLIPAAILLVIFLGACVFYGACVVIEFFRSK